MFKFVAAAAVLLAVSAGQAQAQAGWQLLPVNSGGCMARLEGRPANINVGNASEGRVLVAISRGDWNITQARPPVTLAFDGQAPVQLTGVGQGPAVMVVLSDPDQIARLRAARSLDWTLPQGQYRIQVEGISGALDKAATCGR